MASFYRWEEDTLHLFVKVQPKSSQNAFAEIQEDRIRVRITAPPVDGKANKHLVKYLADVFDVAKSHIEIVNGETGRNKHLTILLPKRLPEGIEK